MDEELELKIHVRGLLKTYVPTYIARDPEQYSQELVSEVLYSMSNLFFGQPFTDLT
jgi:hypothetical protein